MHVFVLLGFCFVALVNNPLVIDEQDHFAQIEMFIYGFFGQHSAITMIPGYHGLLALLASLTGLVSLGEVRFLSFLLGMGTLAVFLLLLKQLGRDRARFATLAFMPVLFPYVFLVYTDVCSLGLVLLSLLLSLRNRPRMAGIAAIAAMLVRQNNVVWLLFVMAYAYEREHGLTLEARRILTHLGRYWVFLAGIVLFAGFVLWNGGVAIGDPDAHPPFAFHTGNVFFLLFLFCLLFFPLVVSRLRGIDWRSLLWVTAALALFFTTFEVGHPYNTQWADVFLRNRLLALANRDVWHRLAFFVPIGLGVAAIARSRLPVSLTALTVVYLLPSWLIEQRYYIIPFALFILLEEDEGRWLRMAGLYFLVLSFAVFMLMEKGGRFL
jgi:alpha-1,2-glucosyltransferase